jgi:hypothetical protein
VLSVGRSRCERPDTGKATTSAAFTVGSRRTCHRQCGADKKSDNSGKNGLILALPPGPARPSGHDRDRRPPPTSWEEHLGDHRAGPRTAPLGRLRRRWRGPRLPGATVHTLGHAMLEAPYAALDLDLPRCLQSTLSHQNRASTHPFRARPSKLSYRWQANDFDCILGYIPAATKIRKKTRARSIKSCPHNIPGLPHVT